MGDKIADDGTLRTFSTGATRGTAEGKLDYEGFLSPRALEAYAEYMNRHRMQPDGTLRPSDNWQRGIPRDEFMKSLWRHVMDLWKNHRKIPVNSSADEACCAIIFNVMGYLDSLLKEREREQ